MKLANVDGRATLVLSDTQGADVAGASGGRFSHRLPDVYEDWSTFTDWANTFLSSGPDPDVDLAVTRLGPPSPNPRQVLAIGRNFHEDPNQVGSPAPDRLPPTFTKFVSALTGPVTTVVLPHGGNTDWEVELVAVIGATARNVHEADAWDHIAGVCVGQDLSERTGQMAGPVPQFSLAKSHPGFAPTGPWLVTPDELADRDDITLGCRIGDHVVQSGSTASLIFSVPALVARLSQTLTLMPGDLIFTGTPGGVGQNLAPPRYLQPGETLTSWACGIGALQQQLLGTGHRQ